MGMDNYCKANTQDTINDDSLKLNVELIARAIFK